MINDSEIIYPLHPVLENQGYTFNMDECYHMALSIGVNPQTLAGTLTGRIKPHSIIVKRMKNIFPSDTVDKLIEDYDPLRNLNFTEHIRKYQISRRYPMGMLNNTDAIRTTDGRWIMIDKKETSEKKVRFFSNDILFGVFNKDDHCVAHINQHHKPNRDKDKALAKLRNEYKIFAEDELARDVLVSKMLDKYD